MVAMELQQNYNGRVYTIYVSQLIYILATKFQLLDPTFSVFGVQHYDGTDQNPVRLRVLNF